MKKWVVYIMSLTLLLKTETIIFAKDNSHIILQQGSNFPISELSFFIPLGTSTLDNKPGVLNLFKKIFLRSNLVDIIEKHGGSYNFSITKDSTHFQISLLSKEVPSFLEEFMPALQTFNVNQEQLELAKKQCIQDIEYMLSKPEQRSLILFQDKAFGTHPYGIPSIGNKNSILSIDLNDIHSIYDTLFCNKNDLYLIYTSNSGNSISGLLDKYWNQFKQKEIKIKQLPDIKFFTSPQNWELSDNLLSQSFVNISYILPPIHMEEKHYMLMLQEIIGGGFNSRLFKILRAEYGLSYSPHVLYSPFAQAEIFDIFYSTKASSTKESENIVESILKDLKENGITQEEFDTTKKLVYNSIIRMQEDNSSLNQLIANDILYTRPIGSIKLLEENIRNSTLDKFNSFIKKILNTYPTIRFVLAGKDAKR